MFPGDVAGVVFHHSQPKDQSDTDQQPALMVCSPFCPHLPIPLLCCGLWDTPGFQRREKQERKPGWGDIEERRACWAPCSYSPFAAWGFPGGGN